MSDIHNDVKEILRLQYDQTRELSAIKAYQLTHKKRIEDLELSTNQNTEYRHKSKGFIAAIYIILGLFGSFIAKKLWS
jgi:hypothetical protein